MDIHSMMNVILGRAMDQIQAGSNVRNGRSSCGIPRTRGFDHNIERARLSEDSMRCCRCSSNR